ncbi:MAG: UDP-N-acetylmuramoyl-L-alanyl-D-glutamate--2,6-diaminopimelate ligase [Actinobacteria bacterium]|nr:UDP-N-acetylmuramoyl-L-alanyl-D-glutamate--2,6-diaminopimelate ligase [Actinomycetota bacterium]
MLRPHDPIPGRNLRAVGELTSAFSKYPDLENIAITGVSIDSHQIEAGDLFVAVAGAKVHGATYAGNAKLNGAVAVLTDEVGAALITDLPVLVVADPRAAAGVIAAWLHNEPMRDMFSVGVTGTNGKTTVTTLLHQIAMVAGRQSGLVGTVETRIGDEVVQALRTTPEAPELQSLAAVMRERHMRNLFMEVSSHAVSLNRIGGSHFDIAAFTNLSQDHLDFHGNMDSYFAAKAALFSYKYADTAYINIDSTWAKKLLEIQELPVVSISRNTKSADWYFERIETGAHSTELAIRGAGGILIETTTKLVGEFNLDNLLMAIAICVASGIDPIDIAAITPSLIGAEGRLEKVDLGQSFTALVDYAHSPDSVTSVLETLRKSTSGKVIALLGCGGDRDKSKRPLMGAALLAGSDMAIFTSDNPRSEDPASIVKDMVSGLTLPATSAIELDRKRAIEIAVAAAKPGDVVVLLGKGHEPGQEIAGVKHNFDDRLVLAAAIEATP